MIHFHGVHVDRGLCVCYGLQHSREYWLEDKKSLFTNCCWCYFILLVEHVRHTKGEGPGAGLPTLQQQCNI